MQTNGRELYFSLKSIFLHIDNQEKSLFARFNLNIPRFYILMHVYKYPGINYIELSDLMLCTKGNTTRVVQAMQKDGLLTRIVNPNDRRCYHLYLTDKGEKIFKEVYIAYKKQIDRILANFSEDQLTSYATICEHIEKVLEPTG
jgi:DNA-binding MarR family transcriptional regulator